MDERDRMEEMLDGALAGYSQAEPRTGIEGRVLAALAAEREATQGRKWWVGAAALCAALLMAALVLMLGERRGKAELAGARPATPAAHAQGSVEGGGHRLTKGAAPARPSAAAKNRYPKVAGGARSAVKRDAAPRQPTFPATSPLSAQEQALMALVRQTPSEELVLQSRAERSPDEIFPAEPEKNHAATAAKERR